MDRIVITSNDVTAASAPAAGPAPSPAPAPLTGPEARALKLGLAVCALVLPLICVLSIAVRIAFRRRSTVERVLWNGYLSTLLAASGLLTTLAFAGWVLAREGRPAGPLPQPKNVAGSLDWGVLPQVPLPEAMSARDAYRRLKPLTAVVTASTSLGLGQSMGAAMLIHATSDGYLFATARHVVEDSSWLARARQAAITIASENREWASAAVIATHKSQDAALLWLPRKGKGGNFCQTIRPYEEGLAGDEVFVIGHPEGLYFSFSTGIVSRLDPPWMLQLTAPISPGNSGGPAYDSRGNLVGIVIAKVDRSLAPNAENLNFALRANVLLNAGDWNFEGSAKSRLEGYTACAEASPATGN